MLMIMGMMQIDEWVDVALFVAVAVVVVVATPAVDFDFDFDVGAEAVVAL